MPESQRPKYGGVPQRVQAEIEARRRHVEAAAVPPPIAPQPAPALMETRLKAIEDRLVRVEDKLDILLDVMTDGGAPSAQEPQPPPAKRKR